MTGSVALAGLFCFAALGQDQLAAKPEIITSVTLDSVQRVLQAMGFEVTRPKDNPKSDPYLIFRADGYRVAASVPAPQFIWLETIITEHATLETINEWNTNNRFSRVYFNPVEKTPVLETEIVVAGGVTQENIEMQIKEFRDSVARWARFLVDHQEEAKVSATQK